MRISASSLRFNFSICDWRSPPRCSVLSRYEVALPERGRADENVRVGASPLLLGKQSLQNTGFLPLGRNGTSQVFLHVAHVAWCISAGVEKSRRGAPLKPPPRLTGARPPFLKSFMCTAIITLLIQKINNAIGGTCRPGPLCAPLNYVELFLAGPAFNFGFAL